MIFGTTRRDHQHGRSVYTIMNMLDNNPHQPMPRGIAFSGDGPLSKVTEDLRTIAAFVQSLLLYGSPVLIRYEDWWEHDGLHFRKGKTDIHALFSDLASPRTLLEAMSDDDSVFTGFGPEDESWYLRYRADWDCRDRELVAAYAIALVQPLSEQFRTEVVPSLSSFGQEQTADQYFRRISDGECSI